VIVSGLAGDAYRLEMARKVGADHVIDVENEDHVTRVREYTGGEGVNVVVNVTGGGRGTVAEAIQVAAKRCNVVLAAAGSETIDVASFGRRKLNLKQANGHSYQSVERAIEYLAAGALPMEEIATHTFGLGQAKEAIETLSGLHGPAIHVSIVPGA
jgi:threonine dehydrogenase-like Zn-dependent dehydrogenase